MSHEPFIMQFERNSNNEMEIIEKSIEFSKGINFSQEEIRHAKAKRKSKY